MIHIGMWTAESLVEMAASEQCHPPVIKTRELLFCPPLANTST